MGLEVRANAVERDVRPDAIPRFEQREVVSVATPWLVVERSGPEGELALQVIDPDDDRADREPHYWLGWSRNDSTAVAKSGEAPRL